MQNKEEVKLCLSPDEAEYIQDLIIRNQYIIRAEIRSVLKEKFEQIGEDCIGEIYLLACEKIDVLKKHKNPDGWIIIAARKVALNMGRKHNTILNKSTEAEIEDMPIDDNVFEDALYNIWLENGSIDKLLDVLTPHEREIYNLLYKRRLPSNKAAEIMKVSDSTIRNINRTIKKKIKNAIETKLF